jgi:hypothetical protein
LDGSCKRATQELAGSCSGVAAVAQQLERHTQDVGSRLQQQAKVRHGCGWLNMHHVINLCSFSYH